MIAIVASLIVHTVCGHVQARYQALMAKIKRTSSFERGDDITGKLFAQSRSLCRPTSRR